MIVPRIRKLRVWHLLLLGPFAIWYAIHEYGRLAALEAHGGTETVDKFTYVLYQTGGKSGVLVVWFGLGAFYLWAIYRVFQLEHRDRAKLAELDEREAALKQPPPEPVKPTRPSPPRIGDDPFRDPPAAPPIVVERPRSEPAAAPIAAGNPDDKPKFLA